MRSALLATLLTLTTTGCVSPHAHTASAIGSGPALVTPTGTNLNRCVTPLLCTEQLPYMDQQLMLQSQMTGPFLPR